MKTYWKKGPVKKNLGKKNHIFAENRTLDGKIKSQIFSDFLDTYIIILKIKGVF